MNIRYLIGASTMAAVMAAGSANATTVTWAALTSDDGPNNGTTVSGVIAAPSGTVSVSYSGGYAFAQINNTGTNYWVPTGFTQGLVNAPATSDIIALGDANTGTITFSQPVQNLFVAFNSWNGANVTFSSPFTIISEGGQGYWGSGTFVPNSNNTGFYGSGEAVGVLEFTGPLTSLTFTDTTNEFWHGFTVGVDNVSAVPLPGALPLFGGALVGIAALARHRAKKTA